MNEGLKNFYHDNGYVLFKDFFSEQEVTDIKSWALEMQNWKEVAGKWMIYFETKENKRCPVRIENFVNYHEKIRNFLYNKLTPLLEDLIGENMVLFKDKLNWKLAGGSGFKSHQDHPAWNDFTPNIFVSMALFVDKNTKENGCLEVSGGVHNQVYNNDYNVGGGLKKDIEESFKWDHLLSNPSDLLIFNSFIPHRSGPNITNNHRRIYYFTFNKESEGNYYNEYYKKKRELLPPDIEKDLSKNYNINNKYNLGNPVTYH
jgi:2-aminoethylphosphonate dioxygenase